MDKYVLDNGQIRIAVNLFGAEQKSLVKLAGTDGCACTAKDPGIPAGTEYMWCADPAYWGRTAPVLFPFVGNVVNKEYRTKGKTYSMGQHGFARDMEFKPVSQSDNELLFRLESNAETYVKYPYEWALECGYKIEGCKETVIWRVINTGKEELPFSIGGHPAFNCPIREGEKQSQYFIKLDTDADKITCSDFVNGQVAAESTTDFPLENGYLEVTEHLFDNDALVIENHQAHKVSLCTPDKKPYLTLTMDAPLLGIWSPVKKNAPFICIEPWYGRADRENFKGELKDREWGNLLVPGEVFEKTFTIEV